VKLPDGFRSALVIALAFTCGACSSRPEKGVLTPVSGTAEGVSRVPLLIATTRERSATDPGEMFGSGRAKDVSYAAITVSIPPDASRKIGDVQWPTSLPGDPSRNFVTVSADYLDRQGFAASIGAMAKKTGRSKVLVFVHGFNNRFDDAVYRFAQIVHDAKAPVIPVLFTWPSRGELRLTAYTYDRESANYSRDALESLLGTLTSDPRISEVTLLAHSMGNWVALEALRGLSIRQARRSDKLKNVLLVAPDVDVDVFRTQIQRMGAARPRIALLVSQDDSALSLSKVIWGGVQRLGDVDPSNEPYRSEFEKDRILVFDLTKVKTEGDNAHDRAFEEAGPVAAMLRKRMLDGQTMASDRSTVTHHLEAAATIGR
jgi:esterase/lipase superfamily enzyme